MGRKIERHSLVDTKHQEYPSVCHCFKIRAALRIFIIFCTKVEHNIVCNCRRPILETKKGGNTHFFCIIQGYWNFSSKRLNGFFRFFVITLEPLETNTTWKGQECQSNRLVGLTEVFQNFPIPFNVIRVV